MIIFQLSCSMCGKEESAACLDKHCVAPWTELMVAVKKAAPKWILELNGSSLDVYCSKRCAK